MQDRFFPSLRWLGGHFFSLDVNQILEAVQRDCQDLVVRGHTMSASAYRSQAIN